MMQGYQATADPDIVSLVAKRRSKLVSQSEIEEVKMRTPPPVKPKPKSLKQKMNPLISKLSVYEHPPKSPKPINTIATVNQLHRMVECLQFKIARQEAILAEMRNDLEKVVNLLVHGNIYD
jgi:hypothetical protein